MSQSMTEPLVKKEKKRRGFFGRRKKSEDADVNDRPNIRKSKSFKRIRGFLTGESRRKKKKAAVEAQEQAARPRSRAADEESTIYGVDLEERSMVSRQTDLASMKQAASKLDSQLAEEKRNFLLRVVLLLMDPESRRFELLQLEFDSLKALVSDVLAQIPVSVTEEALRKQTYAAVCGPNGEEMTPTTLLSDFCKGDEVLVAIPSSFKGKECARLAKPILSDDKVASMLASSGINTTAWREDYGKKKKKKTEAPKSLPSEPLKTPLKPPKSAGAKSKSVLLATVVLLAIILQLYHLYISEPIKVGNVVAPGMWMSKCGLWSFLLDCEDAFFTVDRGGKATFTNANHDILWQMEGGLCRDDDDSCTPGMEFTFDGNVFIGGKQITQVTMNDDCDLSPWPFSEPPQLRIKKTKNHE